MSSRIGRIPFTRGLYSRALILVSLPLLLTTCSHVFGQMPVSAELTGHWQLFVDDHLIESKGGVVRTYHPLIKHPGNPVLAMEGSWGEERTTPYGTVLPGEDGRSYRIWYDIWDGECHNFYATSQDGLHWVRPSLGLVDHQGSRDNNLFYRRSQLDHMPQIIHTPWDVDPQKRYKMINFDFGRKPREPGAQGFWGASSADGIRWTDAPGNPILPDPGDVGHFLWDPHQRRYLGYPKTYAPVRGFSRRSVTISATDRFEHWPPAELILVPDEFDDRWVSREGQHTDFYGLTAFPYQTMYLGFLWVFRITDGRSDGPIFCELVSSRDGVRWDRQEGERTPVLPLGPSGSWDAGQVQTFNHPLLTGGKLRVYYGAFDRTHGFREGNGAIGLATLRKDGFVSLDAESREGTLSTRLLENLEGELRLNADARKGEIRVEVLDREGRVLPGYGRDDCQPMRGDGVDHGISWRSRDGLPASPGPKRLRFHLRNASLFSFHAGNRVRLSEERPAMEAFYSFEAVEGNRIVDQVARDGLQHGRLHGSVKVSQDPETSGGTFALFFPEQVADLNYLEVEDTSHLGHRFTLSARVRPSSRKRMRLFSTQRGIGRLATGELIFDFDPTDGVLRFSVNGQVISSGPAHFRQGQYHHLAASYDRGKVILYLDGQAVGSGRILPGSARLHHDGSVQKLFGSPGTDSIAGVHLATNLRLGADQGGTFFSYRLKARGQNLEQLSGWVDDILVAKRVLRLTEIQALSRPGRGGNATQR